MSRARTIGFVLLGLITIIGGFFLESTYRSIQHDYARHNTTHYVASQQLRATLTEAEKAAQHTLNALETSDYVAAEQHLTAMIQHIAQVDSVATIYVTTVDGSAIVLFELLHSLMRTAQDLEPARRQL